MTDPDDQSELPPFGLGESQGEAQANRTPAPGADPAFLPLGPEHPVVHTLSALQTQLDHLERLIGPEVRAAHHAESRVASSAEARLKPGWQRAHEGEDRLPVLLTVVCAIGLQVALPAHLTFRPTWLLPALEGALLVALTVANPRRMNRTSTLLRSASVALIALTSIANGWSSAELVRGLVEGTEGQSAAPLLLSGASIYLTNIIVFALWYWDWDRGGPVARAQAVRPYPDFLFPQMTQDHLAPPDWTPTFVDYLYTSFTNATAFSPTDTMPLSRWTKLLMALQSAVALTTVALVVSRAVNILK